MVHQPNGWSKRPRIEHVLGYCRDGKMNVGCIELLYISYIVQLTYIIKKKN